MSGHSRSALLILPLLFLLSAVAVGYSMVIFESLLSSRAFKRAPEMDILPGLARFLPLLLFIYRSFKVIDLVIRGAVRHLLDGGAAPLLFLLEIGAGVAAPLLMLLSEKVRRSPALLLTASALVIFGVVLNRINVFLVAYTPYYASRPYFPSLGEIAITVGLVSALVLAYRLLVTVLPILPAEAHGPSGPRDALPSTRGAGGA